MCIRYDIVSFIGLLTDLFDVVTCVLAGGAISNMYSVMVARYKHYPEVKIKGMAAAPRLVLFTSEHVGHLLAFLSSFPFGYAIRC